MKILPAISFALVLVLFSCTQKPVPGIPNDINPRQVLKVIEKRKSMVHDFKGRARAKALIKDKEHTALVYINYKMPDRFRITLKGAFGVVFAIITTNSDSLTVYIPSLKGYIITGKNISGRYDSEILRLLIPEVSFSIDYFSALFNGIYHEVDDPEQSHLTLKRMKDSAVLTITNGSSSYRYMVEGPDLLLKREVLFTIDKTIIGFEYDNYTSNGDVDFPHSVTIIDEASELQLDFSTCEVNKGLSDSDLQFELPQNADRLKLNRTGKK